MSERNPDSGPPTMLPGDYEAVTEALDDLYPDEAAPRKRRERWDLGDGAHMDISLDPDASPETRAALRELGEAAAARMRAENPKD